MLERLAVVPSRRMWMLVALAAVSVGAVAAVPLGARALRTEEPASRPCTFVPPEVPCDEIASLGVCVASGREGAVIVRVTAGSIAEREGWQPGDVIEEISCREVRTPDQVRAALATLSPRLKIVRKGVAVLYRRLEL